MVPSEPGWEPIGDGWYARTPDPPPEKTPCPFCGEAVEFFYVDIDVSADGNHWHYTAHLACAQQRIDPCITLPGEGA